MNPQNVTSIVTEKGGAVGFLEVRS